MTVEIDHNKLYLSPDFAEGVIKHLCRHQEVLNRAKALNVKAEDFGGTGVYAAFANIAVQFDEPVPKEELMLLLAAFRDDGWYDPTQQPEVEQLVEWIYSTDINPEYYLQHLKPCISLRKASYLANKFASQPAKLLDEMAQLAFAVDAVQADDAFIVVSPFEDLQQELRPEIIPTGFDALDAVGCTLGRGEVGLLLGHSGSGKTAMGIHICAHNLALGNKILYISLEENIYSISNRLLANWLNLDYSGLHRGLLDFEKSTALANMDPHEKTLLLRNSKLIGLKNAEYKNCRAFKAEVQKLYETQGFLPDVIIVDQLEFMDPDDTRRRWGADGDKDYLKYEQIVKDLDSFADHEYTLSGGGGHKAAVWIQHQIKGKLTRNYNREAIAKCQGVIKPMDLCLCLGRDSLESSTVDIFTEKARHVKGQRFTFLAQLEHMRFLNMPQTVQSQPEAAPERPRHSRSQNRLPDPRL